MRHATHPRFKGFEGNQVDASISQESDLFAIVLRAGGQVVRPGNLGNRCRNQRLPIGGLPGNRNAGGVTSANGSHPRRGGGQGRWPQKYWQSGWCTLPADTRREPI